jgi:hypothetical protein
MASKVKNENTQRYQVDVELKVADIAKAGSALKVKVHGKSGIEYTIEIGQGSLRWKLANEKRFKKIPWDKLATKLV